MLRIWKVSETSMHRHVCIAAIWALILALLTLVACWMPPATPAPGVVILLDTPVGTSDQATLAAALTQDAIRQTQAQYDLQGTQAAAGTQTAAANNIATQTQSALATSQWYADQSHQRQEQNRGSIAFL